MLTFSQIRATHEVEKQKSFRKAAVELGVSQSTLSRTVQQLEEEIGLHLFERDRRSLTVTSEGRLFLDLTADLLQRATELGRQLSGIRAGQVKLLRVGVGPIVAQTWIGIALRTFTQANRGQAVEIEELRWWELSDALKHGHFEMVIGECTEMEDDPAVAIDPLPNRPFCIAVRAGHRLAALHAPTMADISAYPYVGPRLPAGRLPSIPKETEMGRVSEDGQFFLPRVECSQLSTMLDVVAGSDSFCLTFSRILANAAKDGLLKELPFHPKWLSTRYGIMHLRDRRPSKTVADFQKAAKLAERQYFSA